MAAILFSPANCHDLRMLLWLSTYLNALSSSTPFCTIPFCAARSASLLFMCSDESTYPPFPFLLLSSASAFYKKNHPIKHLNSSQRKYIFKNYKVAAPWTRAVGPFGFPDPSKSAKCRAHTRPS